MFPRCPGDGVSSVLVLLLSIVIGTNQITLYVAVYYWVTATWKTRSGAVVLKSSWCWFEASFEVELVLIIIF
jgi:hypothetical protein